MLARTREAGRRRPQVVIAHSDTAYVLRVARAFRRHGWEVALAAVGQEARRLAGLLAARLVVLETELPDESGWLTCAKLNVGGTGQSVVLVADDEGGRDEEFAEFAGAARIVTKAEGLEPLLEEAGLAMPVKQVV
jgi:DNA-binding response OmpR family regulator